MKQKLWYVASLLLCFSTIFTACSSDNDSPLPIDTDIVGTYKGTLDISLGTQVVGNALPKNITITKASENRINLSLKDFSFEGMNLGTITIANCEVNASESTYSFTGSQTLNLQAPIGECQVKANGTVVNGKATVNLNITVSSLPIAVKVIYQGNRLKGNESAEAKITGFTFESAWVTEQPVIDDAQNTITFKVDAAATTEQINALVPTITISDKATITPTSGVAQKFADGITYTVVAEDGTTKAYKVSIAGNQMVFPFENWGEYISDGKKLYDFPLPKEIWASSAEGAMFLSFYGVEGTTTYKSEDSHVGQYAAKLVTLDTKAVCEDTEGFIPAITAGSLYTGLFNLGDAMTDKLNGTKFGIPYSKKPLYFKGWYKYTPGATFIDGSDTNNIIELPNQKDECAIQAVLYKITDDKEYLTGHDINNSTKRVAVAILTDGTAKAEYTNFNIPFTYLNGETYDKNSKYKIAIVCSSSKEGDKFKGAGGSTLILDELEIVGE